MSDPSPISISWDELGTRKVDTRLRELQAMERSRSHARLANSFTAEAPQRLPRPKKKFAFSYSSIILTTCLGLTGGVLAWGILIIILHGGRSILPSQARDAISALAEVNEKVLSQQITAEEAEETTAQIRLELRSNPWFAILANPQLTDMQRNSGLTQLNRAAAQRIFIITGAGFAACGMIVSLFLAIAVPLKDRDVVGAVNASWIGAVGGLASGLLFGFFGNAVFVFLAGGSGTSTQHMLRHLAARCLAWALFGLLLGAGSGLASRSRNRLLLGMAGGIVGGMAGGIMFELFLRAGLKPNACALVGLLAINILAGNVTAMIDNVAKTCWLKALSGPMARKQFIIYRTPAFIGSAPDCHIFLPRELAVGRRHAALHSAHGRVEIEDLPLGGQTLINGKPVTRQFLRHGDRLQIGTTLFSYQEKVSSGSFFMAYMNLFEHVSTTKAAASNTHLPDVAGSVDFVPKIRLHPTQIDPPDQRHGTSQWG